MKKIIIAGIIILALLCSIGYAIIFDSAADRQEYLAKFNGAKATLTIEDIYDYSSDELEIEWSLSIYTEENVTQGNTTTTVKMVLLEEYMSSVVFSNQTNNQIAQQVKADAKEFFKKWKKSHTVRKKQSLIGQSQTVIIGEG